MIGSMAVHNYIYIAHQHIQTVPILLRRRSWAVILTLSEGLDTVMLEEGNSSEAEGPVEGALNIKRRSPKIDWMH